MKVVVTGAAGFIGSNLTKGLLALDPEIEVTGIDCFTEYYDVAQKKSNIQSIQSKRFTLVEADLNNVDLSVFDDAVAIFHQAGQPGVRKSWGEDFTCYTTENINATQRVLEAARNLKNLEAFIYASSSSIYGDAVTFPTTETDLPHPKSPYGVTKLAAEHLVTLYANNFGMPTTSLRYFTVYGPGQRPDMAFNKFIRAALNSRALEVYGDGEQIREFTHVSDIVGANIRAWKAHTAPGSVINLSGGSAVSVNEVINILTEIHGSPLEVEYQDAALGDVRRTGGSTERARNLLGWTPGVNIVDGLKSEYAWLTSLHEKEAEARA